MNVLRDTHKMKKFIKENWFKLSIIVIILIAIFWYFSNDGRKENDEFGQTQSQISNAEEQKNTYLEQQTESNTPQNTVVPKPQETATQKNLFTKIQCKEIGEKAYNDLVNELGYYQVFNPEYSYNARLNTCLYAGGFFGSDKADYMEMFVKDTISNRAILIYAAMKKNGEFVRIDGFSNTQSVPDFNQKKDALLNE